MKILLIALIIAVLFLSFPIPWIITTYARTRAEQIIQGKRPGTEKQIKMCIRVFCWSNNWISARTGEDQKRIKRLTKMLYEMQNPHG